ncbi:four helix bundle protein [Laspinema olomoucense]|uniref:four helix bundle protein n=1 Tax=Laspinema olomoucense TaxID=3231600 RepID=UPI0021BB6011|nr:four helix bundle protein [Laspinema sp. D3c]MCT7993455.1 four helix bundle protein [Laspinema sp. D3c]
MTHNKKNTDFKNLHVYQLSAELADLIWDIVREWDTFAKNTIGQQIVRFADSIGANIAEGCGRGSFQDNRRFVKIARGSLNETRHWLTRAAKRQLLTEEQINQIKPIVHELAPKLNAYLNSIGSQKSDD